VTRGPLAGAVAVSAAPAGPVAGAEGAPVSGRDVDRRQACAAAADAMLAAYIRAIAQAPPCDRGEEG
jgi:hypothetical protein